MDDDPNGDGGGAPIFFFIILYFLCSRIQNCGGVVKRVKKSF